jgi:hypothetical protein
MALPSLLSHAKEALTVLLTALAPHTLVVVLLPLMLLPALSGLHVCVMCVCVCVCVSMHVGAGVEECMFVESYLLFFVCSQLLCTRICIFFELVGIC